LLHRPESISSAECISSVQIVSLAITRSGKSHHRDLAVKIINMQSFIASGRLFEIPSVRGHDTQLPRCFKNYYHNQPRWNHSNGAANRELNLLKLRYTKCKANCHHVWPQGVSLNLMKRFTERELCEQPLRPNYLFPF